MNVVLELAAILACLQLAYCKTSLSSLIPLCSVKDPKLNECLMKSSQLFLPIMAKGLREYDLPPMDPLMVPNLEVGQDDQAVSLKLTLINTSQTGLSTSKFDGIMYNPKTGDIGVNMTVPFFQVLGDYIGSGKILVLPIVGEGKANFTYIGGGMDFTFRIKPVKVKGKDSISVENFRVVFTFKEALISLGNLFNGNKELGASTNAFLNENSIVVMDALKLTIEDVYSELFGQLMKRFFANVALDDLFKNE